jgi:hypothetical protein
MVGRIVGIGHRRHHVEAIDGATQHDDDQFAASLVVASRRPGAAAQRYHQAGAGGQRIEEVSALHGELRGD